MAVTAVVPTNARIVDTNAGSATSLSTGSWTPAAGIRTYLAFASAGAVGGPPEPALSGNGDLGGSWVLAAGGTIWDPLITGSRRIWCWRAREIASAGAHTFDFGIVAPNHVIAFIVELDGVDGATNDGVVQVDEEAHDADGTTHTITLASFGDAGNATVMFCVEDDNTEPSAEAGWTSLDSGNTGTPNTVARVAYLASADTSPSMSGNNVNWAGIALEIKAAADLVVAKKRLIVPRQAVHRASRW